MPEDIMGVPGQPLIASSTTGFPLTISAILKQPTFVKAYLLSIADYLFVAEKLFRPAQDCPSGSVVYYASTPVFADTNAGDLAEFEEIPTAITQLGVPSTSIARRKGLAVTVSEQMRTRNDVNALVIQLQQVQNTLIKNFDAQFMTLLDDSVVTESGGSFNAQGSHVVAAGGTWATTSYADFRSDIASTALTVVDEDRGFNVDAMLIDQSTYWGLLGNPSAWQIYQGNIANLNPQFVGKLPVAIMGMEVHVTINGNIPSGDAYLMQKGVFGGISNERPLTATPWYLERPHEMWRSDVTRSAAPFVDQPLAIAKITGVR